MVEKVYVADKASKAEKASRASSAVDRPTQAEDGHWYVLDPQENNWVHSDHGTWSAPTIETAPEMYNRVPTPSPSPRPIQVPDSHASKWNGKEPLPYAPSGSLATKPLDFYIWYTGFGYDARAAAVNVPEVPDEVLDAFDEPYSEALLDKEMSRGMKREIQTHKPVSKISLNNY